MTGLRLPVLAVASFFAFFLAACSAPQVTPEQTATHAPSEEAEIRQAVETFGKQLQAVSLLAPDAAQEIQAQYSGFVSPALLAEWMDDPSKAPGRVVSSPWPDHIEITSVTGEGNGNYEINGFVIEVTSVEVVNGGAAARIPVRLVVQRVQSNWLITEYSQEK